MSLMESSIDPALTLPSSRRSPGQILWRRFFIALALLIATTLVVYLGRAGYHDSYDGSVSLLDSLYYATVSLSTTGYGDIVPVTDFARLVNIAIITPLRVAFLIVLVGTTVEVLTTLARDQARARRWRRLMNGHTIVVGYGTKGRAAVAALADSGVPVAKVLVIDIDQHRLQQAGRDSFATVHGDATEGAVLSLAEVDKASRVVIACDRDDTSVLVTLSVRQLAPQVVIVAAVTRAENASLLRAAGCAVVVVSDEAAGRLLGVSAMSPATGEVVTDLLVPGSGLELVERASQSGDAARLAAADAEAVLGVVRNGSLLLVGDGQVGDLHPDDRLITIRSVPSHPTTR